MVMINNYSKLIRYIIVVLFIFLFNINSIVIYSNQIILDGKYYNSKEISLFVYNLSFKSETTYKYPYAASISPRFDYIMVALSNKTGTNYGSFSSLIKFFKVNLNYNKNKIKLDLMKELGPIEGRVLDSAWISPSTVVLGIDTGYYSGHAYILIYNLSSDTIVERINYTGYDYVHSIDYCRNKKLLAVGVASLDNASNRHIFIYKIKNNKLYLIKKIYINDGVCDISFFNSCKDIAGVGAMHLYAIEIQNENILYNIKLSYYSYSVKILHNIINNNELLVVPIIDNYGLYIYNASSGKLVDSIGYGGVTVAIFRNYIILGRQQDGNIYVFKYNNTVNKIFKIVTNGSFGYNAYSEGPITLIPYRHSSNVIILKLIFSNSSGLSANSKQNNSFYNYYIIIGLLVGFGGAVLWGIKRRQGHHSS